VTADAANVPRVLGGRYRLERPLAFGGVAEVWTATDTVLDRKVAVKLLRAEFASDPLVVERFRREAVAAARLNHPNIVNVFDTVNDDGLEAVIMELVPGRSLRQLLDDEGRLSIADTVHIGIALSDALDAAHRGGLIHRDVKPANVLITPAHRVLLTDFGIATAISRTKDLTRDDVMVGTAKYLSPEQVLGVPTDARSDLYSLGIVLHECLTGQVPFDAETDAATALARLQRPARPVRTLRPGVPRALDELISSCLTRSPDGRPASAALVRDTLVRMDGTDTDDGRVIVSRDPTPSNLSLPTTGPMAQGLGTRSPSNVGSVGSTHAAPVQSGRWTVAVVLVLLLGVAAVIAGALLRGPANALTHVVRPGASAVPTSDPTTSLTDPPLAITSPELGTGGVTATTAAKSTGPNSMIGASEFDPPPGNGAEYPGKLISLTDGDTATEWTSVCYDNANMLPKHGVGLILELRDPTAGHNIEIVSRTSGWSATVYVTAVPGDTLAKWGNPVSVGKDIPAGSATFPLGASANRYVLVWFTTLGRSSTCTLPFQMRVGEVRVLKAASK
jgi:eukaryotic-like serine/threonine-protein kinase